MFLSLQTFGQASEVNGMSDGSGDNYLEGILDTKQRKTLMDGIELKNRKLDELIGQSMKSDRPGQYDSLVQYLKSDIKICEALLGMDLYSEESVAEGFDKVLHAVTESVKPKHLDLYGNLLDNDEKAIERDLAEVFMHIQRIMLGRYSYLVED